MDGFVILEIDSPDLPEDFAKAIKFLDTIDDPKSLPSMDALILWAKSNPPPLAWSEEDGR